MKNLLNPKWLIAINTVPISVLFFLLFQEYKIIKSLLSGEQITLWVNFGIVLALLAASTFTFSIWLEKKKKRIPIYYGILTLIGYIGYLYIYGYYSSSFIPFSVPRWILPESISLYVGTFLMPTLAHSLIVLVVQLIPKRTWFPLVDYGMVITIPVTWYIFFQLIFPLWTAVESGFMEHVWIIMLVASTVVFLFFLMRGVYTLIVRSREGGKFISVSIVFKLVIALILPVIGLLLNNGHLEGTFESPASGIFGDFSSVWFYGITILNALVVCLPNKSNVAYRCVLFIGRSITFAYTLYFFVVFLPYLPLSVLAIILLGAGFLMLTPTALFIVHLFEISEDIKFLIVRFPKPYVVGLGILSALIIPLSLVGSYTKDRMVLHEALDYLYNPDYSKEYLVDKESLSKTMGVVKSHKGNSDGSFFSIGTPYLSSLYTKIVLDNLTISDDKIMKIDNVFFGKFINQQQRIRRQSPPTEGVGISNVSVETIYDNEQKVWKSWVDFKITNENSNSRFSEFVTSFELPEGCWISDYYLLVGDEKKKGILAEKKAAMWVYSQITNTNRDPGILYYLSGNRVGFRVFPFSQKETRKTGIEFLHKEPVTLSVDEHEIQLGSFEDHYFTSNSVLLEDVAYISKDEKKKLTPANRSPYFHFIVNTSRNEEERKEEYISRIEELLSSYQIREDESKISFVNMYTTSESMDEDWRKKLREYRFEGGFFADRAIRKVLIDSYVEGKDSYPIIVLVSNDFKSIILEENFSDLDFTFPESDLFYSSDNKSDLFTHSLMANPKRTIDKVSRIDFEQPVLAWPNGRNPKAYLRTDSSAEIVLLNRKFTSEDEGVNQPEWISALLMEAKWRFHTINPEKLDLDWRDLLKRSFSSQIMTPLTSFIVVETEAQEAILKRKQQQVLNGDKDLDLGDGVERMSEPGFFLIILLLSVFLVIRKLRLRYELN